MLHIYIENKLNPRDYVKITKKDICIYIYHNTPPQAGANMSIMPSLLHI